MSKQTILFVAFVCAFVLVPVAFSAPQTTNGIVGKLKELFAKLTGDGIHASCKAIPSLLDSIVPACLTCDEETSTWRIKSGLGLLKCRKSRKSEKGGKNGAKAQWGAGGISGVGTVMTAAAMALLILAR